MDDQIKLWYDFVSREKEEANRIRRHCWTFILPFAGAILWIVSNPFDYLALAGLLFFMSLIAILLVGTLAAGLKDKIYCEIQYGIVSGRLANTKLIDEEYNSKTAKLMAFPFQKGYNDAAVLLEPKP